MNSPSDEAAPSVLKSSRTSPNAWTFVPMTRPRLVRATEAVVAPVPPMLMARVEVEVIALVPAPRSISPEAREDVPVPPSATAKSVIPVIDPLVMVTSPDTVRAPEISRATEGFVVPIPT